MSYYLRAFCKNPKLPTLAALQAWLRKEDSKALICDKIGKDGLCRAPAKNLKTSTWKTIALRFQENWTPIVVETHAAGAKNSLCRAESQEFADRIGPAGRSARKKRVLDHLAATRLIVSCRIPGAADDESEEESLAAASIFLRYFLRHRDALIQADLEGFYDADHLLVRLDDGSWTFDQGPLAAAITTRRVLEDKLPILVVQHFADDHSWSFVCGTTNAIEDARVIAMDEALRIDPTLRIIADLPPGWHAWRRRVGGKWGRGKMEAAT